MEEGEWEVGKGEGDACCAGGDDIDAVTTVVGEGGAKVERRLGPHEGPKRDGGRGH